MLTSEHDRPFFIAPWIVQDKKHLKVLKRMCRNAGFDAIITTEGKVIWQL